MSKGELVIIAAIDDELRSIYPKMETDLRIHVRPALITKGKYQKKNILLVRSGVGTSAMEHAVEYLKKNIHCSLILHIGYCGGAEPNMSAGDLIVADRVILDETGQTIEMDNNRSGQAMEIAKRIGLKACMGGLTTVGTAARTPHEKAFIGTKHGTLGIDMESFPLADMCKKANIPCLIVRSVLDPMDEIIPDLGDVINSDGSTSGASLARHVIKTPKDIFKLPRVQYLAAEAREALTSFVEAFLNLESTHGGF